MHLMTFLPLKLILITFITVIFSNVNYIVYAFFLLLGGYIAAEIVCYQIDSVS